MNVFFNDFSIQTKDVLAEWIERRAEPLEKGWNGVNIQLHFDDFNHYPLPAHKLAKFQSIFFINFSIVLFAGDVSPIEIMCHLPAVCEEKSVPYAYVPSRHELGAAMGVKRGTVTVLVREHAEYKDLYDELKKEITLLPVPWWIIRI